MANGALRFRGEDLINKVKTVIITDGVTSIKDGAFSNMDNLTTVVIGNDVEAINSLTFRHCYTITYDYKGE